MMTMKRFFGLATLLSVMLAFFSCEPAESRYEFEYFYDNIYTVNKHKVRPEFQDSLLTIYNMDKYGLETGHRARMVLKYYFDYSTMAYPKWEIAELIDVIPTLPLQAKDAVNAEEYNTLFTSLNYYELMDRYLQPVWVWNGLQNINIEYKGLKDNAQFAMTVRGIGVDETDEKNVCVEFDLYAKAQQSGNVKSSKLLTFDISNVADFLTDEQKSRIAGIDSLKTRIFLKSEVDGVVKETNILGGKFANPLK